MKGNKNNNYGNNEIFPKNNNNYERDLEHVQGNAFTGEQVRIVRNCQTERPMTDEEIERNWGEMEQQARILRNAYPGEVIFAENLPKNLQISNSDSGNQLVSQGIQEGNISRISSDKIPENERIQIAMYDDNGSKIIGSNNIRREVRRREAQWEQWKREGKLQEVQQTYTVGGKNVTVKFRGIPGQMYSQNAIQNFLPVVGISEEEVEKVASIQSSSPQITEIVDDKTGVGGKRQSQNASDHERNKVVKMDIDQPETSTNEDSNLVDKEQLESLSEEQIVSLINQLKAELEKRSNEKGSASYQKYESQLEKAEFLMKGFQSSNLQPSSSDNKSSVGLVVGSVAGISALVIGGIVLVKNKLGKKK